MSKELPFFKFTPSEWLIGKISYQPLEIQGAFMQCCCMFWKLNGNMKAEDIDFRIGKDKLKQLLEYDFIIEENGYLKIKFLEEQLVNFEGIREQRKLAGAAGAAANAKKRVAIAKNKPANVQQSSADIRHKTKDEDKDKDSIDKEDSIKARKSRFAATLTPYVKKYGREMLKEFYEYWTEMEKGQKKYRQESEKHWSLGRRLSTWHKKEKKFSPGGAAAKSQPEEQKVIGRQNQTTVNNNLEKFLRNG